MKLCTTFIFLCMVALTLADHGPARTVSSSRGGSQRNPLLGTRTVGSRQARQQNVLVNGISRTIKGGIDFSNAVRNEKGQLCVIKEGTVQSIAKDPILNCVHQNVEKCHYTYVTIFKPNQEEVCEENFEKQCQITFKQQATTETVRKCYRPQNKVCNGQGPEECRTVYESSCTTRYVKKQNAGRFVGDTSCEKLPIEICGAGCVVEQGPEECHDKEQASLVDVPEEVCDLNPQKTCQLTTKLAPSLKPKHECTIIPKETCNLVFSSPRTIDKPLREEWCLDESPVVRDETYNEAGSLANPIRSSDATVFQNQQSGFPFDSLVQLDDSISSGGSFISGDFEDDGIF